MGQPDDNTLIDKVLNGHTAAFEIIVNRYKEMVFTVALRIARNSEDAEEIAMDAFMKAYSALAGFRKESKFSTWLYRIAHNTAISTARKRKITITALDDELIENYSDEKVKEEINTISDEEQSILLNKVLAHLPSGDNLLINMFYTDNLSIDEISEITGLSISNVKVKLHRVRKKLFNSLSHELVQHGVC